MLFASLIAALAEVRDPRRAQGQRYSMRHLVLASVLAMLAGATSYRGIITFIALQRERLNAVFGACFRRAPAVNTLRHFFLALDRDDLEAAFRRHTSAEVERQSRSKDTDIPRRDVAEQFCPSLRTRCAERVSGRRKPASGGCDLLDTARAVSPPLRCAGPGHHWPGAWQFHIALRPRSAGHGNRAFWQSLPEGFSCFAPGAGAGRRRMTAWAARE